MASVIPIPKKIKSSGELATFSATICSDSCFADAVEVFTGYARDMGITFVQEYNGAIMIKKNSTLLGSSYKISVNPKEVVLEASDEQTIHYGFATILQMMIQDENTGKFQLPLCTIEDFPDCSYRGLMVDLGRVWHSFDYLLSYVDLCYFYKVSFLHLHFTEFQSYTLPSKHYPKLSVPGRHYTREQIGELVKYAQTRGVQLVPEIDVPGHSACFCRAYPELFEHPHIIPYHEDSICAVKTLFAELCELFPNSKYIHIGGDEAALVCWAECEKCTAYGAKKNLFSPEEYLADFISEMAAVITAAGRTPVVWEGFVPAVNTMISRDILVMSFENYYQTVPDLLNAGFKIVNCSWIPMYLIEPAYKKSTAEMHDWSVNRWTPMHRLSPYYGTTLEVQPNSAIIGGQFHAWGDNLLECTDIASGVYGERLSIIERLPFLAEKTWNANSSADFDSLSTIAEYQNNRFNRYMISLKA